MNEDAKHCKELYVDIMRSWSSRNLEVLIVKLLIFMIVVLLRPREDADCIVASDIIREFIIEEDA